MNRGMFFKGFAALLGMGQESVYDRNKRAVCHEWPQLKGCETVLEGEEFCPLGHAQKPRFLYIDGKPEAEPVKEVEHHAEYNGGSLFGGDIATLPWTDGTSHRPAYDSYRTNLRICATCGIVYVKAMKQD